MTRPILLLARLNAADLAVDATKARLVEIADALREPAALVAARQAAAASESEATRLRREQQALEREQADADAAIKKIEARLYGGAVKSPRELQDSERDLAQHRRQKSLVEDKLLEVMVVLDAANAAQGRAKTDMNRLASEWEARQIVLRSEQAVLKERLPGELARQATARQHVPADLLRTYEALRPRRGGRAVAELDGDECSVCLVAVPQSKQDAARFGDELVYCGNCGRLLWGE